MFDDINYLILDLSFNIEKLGGVLMCDRFYVYVIFHNILTQTQYLETLQITSTELLQLKSAKDVVNMWFQHNETHSYNTRINGGPVAWPERLQELTLLDFCIWGYLKDNVL